MNFQRYAQLKNELAEIQNELAALEGEMKVHVLEHGTTSGYGYVAKMKPGRKSTDHAAAAAAANVSDEIIAKHSTTKVVVAWAKVTKDAGVDVSQFTKQGDPVFVIEAL